MSSVNIFELSEKKIIDPVVYKRAKHVITENNRVLEAKNCLLESNIEKFGKLMNDSHDSLKNNFTFASTYSASLR